MLAAELVMQTTEAAFSRGPDGVITAWNSAAERLFLRPSRSAVGKRCFDVVSGCDVFGNDYCADGCACWRMAALDRPIHPFRITAKDARGRPIDLRVTVRAARSGRDMELVHLLERAASRRATAPEPNDPDNVESAGACGTGGLTRRELEVLRLLSEAMGTEEIAQRLAISMTTVRNHICRCLAKLDAHSRLEAVTVARRLDLV